MPGSRDRPLSPCNPELDTHRNMDTWVDDKWLKTCSYSQDDLLKLKPTNIVGRKGDLSAFESDVVANAGWDDLSISCLLKTVDLLVYYLHFPHIPRLYFTETGAQYTLKLEADGL